MGQELECTMHYQKRALAGKAQLETDYLLFRTPSAERLKILFADLTSVTASAGVLKLEFAGGPAHFDLGRAAEKWATKILHPPSRLEKLGVKPGAKVRLVGDFDEDFLRELAGWRTETPRAPNRPDLLFFAASTSGDLNRIDKLVPALEPAGALWVVYPRGIAAIREIEVLQAGRAAGLKDVKVARFSATHTALKFVVPLAAR